MEAVLNLKQRNLFVTKYEKEFSHLTEAFRCRQFEDGLNECIKGIWHLLLLFNK